MPGLDLGSSQLCVAASQATGAPQLIPLLNGGSHMELPLDGFPLKRVLEQGDRDDADRARGVLAGYIRKATETAPRTKSRATSTPPT